jgi:hypothetical protein
MRLAHALVTSVSLMAAACSDPAAGPCSGDDAPAVCGQPCSVDADCGFGFYCSGGSCHADCSAGGGECASGERCDANGRCVTVDNPDPCQSSDAPIGCGQSCSSDFDCGPGLYCDGSKCTADCTPNGDQCDQGTHCSSDGRCAKNASALDCPDVAVSLSPVIPRVMLLIDQSGSMTDPFGKVNGSNVNRWQAVRYALTDPKDGAVTKLQASVRFTATLYHSKGGSKGGTCPIITHTTGTGEPALNNRGPIDDLLAKNSPVQDTPTAESIDAVVKEMKSWAGAGPDAQPAPRVLVLATDGDPDNCADSDAHDATSQKMSETAAQDAFKAGIESYVLSVGADVTETHLKRMANAGLGKPLDPPDAPFFRGNDPAELVQAFDTIIRGLRTCLFTLDQAVQAQYAQSGTVTLNGTTLTFNVDWVLKDDKTIELKGAACQTFKDADSVNLQASFPCGAVID